MKFYQVGEEHHASGGNHEVGSVPRHDQQQQVHHQPERERRPVGSKEHLKPIKKYSKTLEIGSLGYNL
jgi:hypothetical protein